MRLQSMRDRLGDEDRRTLEETCGTLLALDRELRELQHDVAARARPPKD